MAYAGKKTRYFGVFECDECSVELKCPPVVFNVDFRTKALRADEDFVQAKIIKLKIKTNVRYDDVDILFNRMNPITSNNKIGIKTLCFAACGLFEYARICRTGDGVSTREGYRLQVIYLSLWMRLLVHERTGNQWLPLISIVSDLF